MIYFWWEVASWLTGYTAEQVDAAMDSDGDDRRSFDAENMTT
jgi:hypothetical protein